MTFVYTKWLLTHAHSADVVHLHDCVRAKMHNKMFNFEILTNFTNFFKDDKALFSFNEIKDLNYRRIFTDWCIYLA